jgi:CRISPR/Cas system-associated exonuclease Cas4 (RecB family)
MRQSNNDNSLLGNIEALTANKVLGDYYESLIKFHTKHGEDFPKREIRRGALQSPCSRSSWYFYFFDARPALSNITDMAIGTLVHGIPMYSKHELHETWQGIRLDVDEYDPETGIMVEKKTAKEPNKYMPYESHRTQLEHGRAMLQDLGYSINSAWILYIFKDGSMAQVYNIPETRSKDEVLNEIRERKKILEEYIEKKELPPRMLGYQCGYCEFGSLCFQNKTGFENLGELLSSL